MLQIKFKLDTSSIRTTIWL